LVQALGGGWNVKELPAASKVTSKEAAQQVNDVQPASADATSTQQ
jgi:hypothetical protein